MKKTKELKNELITIVGRFKNENFDKLMYREKESNGIYVEKYCDIVSAYAYSFLNHCNEKMTNIILVADGWNDYLDKLSTEGISYGYSNKLESNINIFVLSINDFDLSEDGNELYKNAMILFDKIGMFKKENNTIKKLVK